MRLKLQCVHLLSPSFSRFHKGQHIFIESKEHGQERSVASFSSCNAVLHSVTQCYVLLSYLQWHNHFNITE